MNVKNQLSEQILVQDWQSKADCKVKLLVAKYFKHLSCSYSYNSSEGLPNFFELMQHWRPKCLYIYTYINATKTSYKAAHS